MKGASIGEGCVILPKVTIEEGAVVGAGTIIRRKVKANTIVIGNQELLKSMIK